MYLYSDRATGDEIGDLIGEHGIDYEYSNQRGVLLIFSFQNTDNDFVYVTQVIEEIYQIIAGKEQRQVFDEHFLVRTPVIRCSPREAFFGKKKKLLLEQAKGMISCCCFKQVPPGIPILILGEEITDWHLQQLPPNTVLAVVKE
ncbi:hypothetical protein PI95_023215 [Hassallia byssoidea VB512170]|uniref:Uncharacterized protein n=1 Tax=Hassallia byssoidea VB512170 TaxID=1304833 RepID=A0A846HDI9_9CYAN|nr:hypothetical protein [Hassalia byssoidea]NEU75385.1 hypothetical protein [Hassalia byssoidea VB512170]